MKKTKFFPSPGEEKIFSQESLEAEELGKSLGILLWEHRGGDVIALDLRGENTWTDFFVIATATSGAHLAGLERQVREFCGEKGIDILRVSPRSKGISEDEWLVIDLGALVIHLMTGKIREFYELERLWDTAGVLFRSPPAASLGRASP
ncbi:MAG: ribosome silencing factor [Spirochaetaceae bacterium]|nr:ribosome silencing factor [Spirochaetaceae bacterium]